MIIILSKDYGFVATKLISEFFGSAVVNSNSNPGLLHSRVNGEAEYGKELSYEV